MAEVGLDDASGGGSVEFEVLVDGELRGRSGVVRPGQRLPLEVDVAGANTVTLRVRNAGDGYMCDHAVWGLARFLTDPAHDPIESEL